MNIGDVKISSGDISSDIFTKFIIAVDGPAASGKSSVGQKIAEMLNLYYLESGLFYRFLAFKFESDSYDQNMLKVKLSSLKSQFFFDELFKHNFAEQALKIDKISYISSMIASYPFVRRFVNEYLKEFVRKKKRVVVDGRDIGSVVFPEADLKIYVTADLEIRAKRRYNELKLKNDKLSFEDVLNAIKKRDCGDVERTVSPLVQAKGAIRVDTSSLTLDQAVKKILTFVK